jgi:folylpolyglutamate synthase/dihydropteroate synthase
MNITYKINNLERQVSDDLVIVAHWRVDAVDGEHTAGAYGSVGFTRGDDFTPFEELTEAQVIEWVKAQLDVAEIEASLAGQIDKQKNPVTAHGLPWTPEVSSE